jgi:ribosomal subunit interface protein
MLKINIKETNIKLDDFIYDYINEKIGGLDRFIDNSNKGVQAWVEVGKPSKHHKTGPTECYAEVNIQLSKNGRVIRAESWQKDLRLAIDEVKNILQLELEKFRGKQEAKYKRGARKAKEMLR